MKKKKLKSYLFAIQLQGIFQLCLHFYLKIITLGKTFGECNQNQDEELHVHMLVKRDFLWFRAGAKSKVQIGRDVERVHWLGTVIRLYVWMKKHYDW